MNKPIKILLFVILAIVLLLEVLYYSFLQIDFIGYKDPKTVEENLKRRNNICLSAEYRDGTDYCNIELVDSINIDINVGDKAGGTFLNENYHLSGDTIILQEGIAPHAKQYLNSRKFLIANEQIYFLLDSNGNFDTSKTMDVKINKIKL